MNTKTIIICGLLCMLLANEASSFVLTKKLIAVKAPIVKAKVKAAKDIKIAVGKGIAAAALVKKKAVAAVGAKILAPIVIVKGLKKKILAKKVAAIAAPIIAVKGLKKSLMKKKIVPLLPIIGGKGKGIGAFALAPAAGLAFAPWDKTNAYQQSQFRYVPPQYSSVYVDDGSHSETPSGGFIQNTLYGAEKALESLGKSVPILHTLTNGVSQPISYVRTALTPEAPKAVYNFVPDLGFTQYSNVNYAPNVDINVPYTPTEHDTNQIVSGQQIQGGSLTQEFSVSNSHAQGESESLSQITGFQETYGPPSLPHIDSSQSSFNAGQKPFEIPSTNYGVPIKH